MRFLATFEKPRTPIVAIVLAALLGLFRPEGRPLLGDSRSRDNTRNGTFPQVIIGRNPKKSQFHVGTPVNEPVETFDGSNVAAAESIIGVGVESRSRAQLRRLPAVQGQRDGLSQDRGGVQANNRGSDFPIDESPKCCSTSSRDVSGDRFQLASLTSEPASGPVDVPSEAYPIHRVNAPWKPREQSTLSQPEVIPISPHSTVDWTPRWKPVNALHVQVPQARNIAVRTALPHPNDRDHAASAFAQDGVIDARGIGMSRGLSYCLYGDSALFSHRPLYFEERRLERHGHSLGLAQPIVSTVRFYSSAILLPAQWAVRPCWKYESPPIGELPPGADATAEFYAYPCPSE